MISKNSRICVPGAILAGSFGILALIKIAHNHYNTKKPKIPKEYLPIAFKEEELTLDNFENILKKHTIRLHETKIIEEVLPREFISEEQLEKISNNFIYAKGEQDLLSLTKVLSD